MVESCTNCGQCEDVCPMDIPLAKIWHQINQKINELKYSPGMDKQDLDLFEYFERPD
jgi:formate dehydrogenase subunit beta